MLKFLESTTEPDVLAGPGVQRDFARRSLVKAPKGWADDCNVLLRDLDPDERIHWETLTFTFRAARGTGYRIAWECRRK